MLFVFLVGIISKNYDVVTYVDFNNVIETKDDGNGDLHDNYSCNNTCRLKDERDTATGTWLPI